MTAKIVCCSKSGKILKLLRSILDVEIQGVSTQEELANYIVSGCNLSVVLIHLPELSKLWERFLISVKKTFPWLEVCLILPAGRSPEVPGIDVVHLEEDSLVETVRRYLANPHQELQRKRQRFDWPLKGRLIIPGEMNEEFRVRSISAGGAFLESGSYYPGAGKQGNISVNFHDFKILVGCQIMARRDPQGALPAGFGIKFIDMTTISREILDEMVQDELLRSLLEPDKPPRPPSIS